MAQKKVILTWVGDTDNDPRFQKLGQTLAQNGLDVSGNPWIDDLQRLAWLYLSDFLKTNDSCDAWVMAVTQQALAKDSIRYGISACIAAVNGDRSIPLPVFLLGVDFQPVGEKLPTLLQNAQILTDVESNWGAKVVAKLFRNAKPTNTSYRFCIKANPNFGQWFEIGPVEDTWEGVMFGVNEDATLGPHAVGPKGVLPEKSILEFPVQGIQAEIGTDKFVANSVQNTLKPGDSYFVKVDGAPNKIIFAGHPGTDQQDVFVIHMV